MFNYPFPYPGNRGFRRIPDSDPADDLRGPTPPPASSTNLSSRQNFSLSYCDSEPLPGSSFKGMHIRPPRDYNCHISGHSEFRMSDDGQYVVALDVYQFAPPELSVKAVKNCIVVHGKHDTKADDHGFVSREFTRRLVLPEGVQPESVVSSLSADGVLTIQAPNNPPEAQDSDVRIIPIACSSAMAGSSSSSVNLPMGPWTTVAKPPLSPDASNQ